MTKVLVLDIGNSNTKCYIFERKEDSIEILHEASAPTRPDPTKHSPGLAKRLKGHPWDVAHTCRNLAEKAILEHQPVCGIVSSFGDAFVYADPAQNNVERFVFAEESADLRHAQDFEWYKLTGFPAGNTKLTGIESLRAKHEAPYASILPVNIYVAKELCHGRNHHPISSNDGRKWKQWDITQASVSGEFDMKERTWVKGVKGAPLCEPSTIVGHFSDNLQFPPRHKARWKPVPILAGGMDNCFADTTEQTPYIIAGTWCVVSVIHDTFHPTLERMSRGVRWIISGNGRYMSQTVRKSDENSLSKASCENILEDLDTMGVHWNSKVRIYGAYAEELAEKLSEGDFHLRNLYTFEPRSYAEDLKLNALYAYYNYRDVEREKQIESVNKGMQHKVVNPEHYIDNTLPKLEKEHKRLNAQQSHIRQLYGE